MTDLDKFESEAKALLDNSVTCGDEPSIAWARGILPLCARVRQAEASLTTQAVLLNAVEAERRVAHMLAESLEAQLQQVRGALEKYGDHENRCILSFYEGGRPTDGGGYEVAYRGQWYEVTPVDQRPACTCGFLDALAASGGTG